MRGRETIHVLHQALTLCGYGHDKLPGHWPEGQLWIRRDDMQSLRDPRMCKECFRLTMDNLAPAEPSK